MASNRITVDGDQSWLYVSQQSCHIAVAGNFGGGTITVEQNINGATYPLLDEAGSPIVFTAAADINLLTVVGDEIRLTMSGSTSPVVDWNVSGASISR